MKNIIFATIFGLFCIQSYAMSDKEICELRANSMHAIAVERDAGKTKKQVKAIVRNKLRYNLPDSFDLYLDAIYKEKTIKPEDIRVVILHSCYQEFGLIK